MSGLPTIKVAQPKMGAPAKPKPMRMSVIRNMLMRGKAAKSGPKIGNY